MRLSPHEVDKLVIAQVGSLAQKRLWRGLQLNYSEAVGLIAYVVLEWIRDGNLSVAQIMTQGRHILGIQQCMSGVPSLISEVQVEGTFPDGTKLVTIQSPIHQIHTNWEYALYSSGLTIQHAHKIQVQEATKSHDTSSVPSSLSSSTSQKRKLDTVTHDSQTPYRSSSSTSSSASTSISTSTSTLTSDDWSCTSTPGEIITNPERSVIPLNTGANRSLVQITVANHDDRPIQVGSHYHFIECNPYLVFDRALSYGRRLNIPAGTAVRFEPGESRTVTLVSIGGTRTIHGGNGLVNGAVNEQSLSHVMQRVKERRFGHVEQAAITFTETSTSTSTSASTNSSSQAPHKRAKTEGGSVTPSTSIAPAPTTITSAKYAAMFGPTTGDLVRLGDTCLFAHVDMDHTIYGEECKFGGGKTLRDGMGQSSQATQEEALDLLIANALILDSTGIYKADIGIKNGIIVGIGKSGNPDTMDGVEKNLVAGVTTEVIDASGLILTAGAIDTHVHFICPQLVAEALASGITTLIGGGTGPTSGTTATTCTPGAHHIGMMLQATDDMPINIGFTGKGNSAKPTGLESQIIGGAIGLKLHEDWGTTPVAIDCCLSIAEKYDVQVTIHTDTLNESCNVEGSIEAFKGRTIHTYHTEGAGGGHAPDILRVVGDPHVLPSSTNPTRPYTVNTLDEHIDMLMVCHHLNKQLPEDISFAESRIRGETIAAEDVLHDLGAISMMSSDAQAMGRIGEVISRCWQTAHKMKLQRGTLTSLEPSLPPLPTPSHPLPPSTSSDNARIQRYISKYTINPAIAHGIAHRVGSIEIGKLADIVLWKPAFFGTKPESVLKSGVIVWAQMGDANASIPTPEPILMRPMYGAHGPAASALSVAFVSQVAIQQHTLAHLGLKKRLEPVVGCRSLTKSSMRHNSYLPVITVDPETFHVTCDGTHLTCTPCKTLPATQRYYIF